MIDFLTIILLIFGLLQIILFFKVWGMTNDIKEIRNKYLKDEDEKRRQEAEYDPTPKISSGSKPTMWWFYKLFTHCLPKQEQNIKQQNDYQHNTQYSSLDCGSECRGFESLQSPQEKEEFQWWFSSFFIIGTFIKYYKISQLIHTQIMGQRIFPVGKLSFKCIV